MPSEPPVDFEALARGPTGVSNRDYPYAIKASDLMQDFVFATLDGDENMFEETSGMGGHRQRRLRINAGAEANQIAYWNGDNYVPMVSPSANSILQFDGAAFSWLPAPGSGTYVLGSVDGTIQWLATEDC